MSLVLGALFCVPGVVWLVIESRWGPAPAPVAEVAAASIPAEEEVLEDRIR